MLYEADQNAQIGWDHIIRSPTAKRDAEAALCLTEAALAIGFDSMLFRRRLRILMDLGRDAEMRRAIQEVCKTPEQVPGGAARSFAAYARDPLGVGRETEAGELALLLRELDPKATPELEHVRRAIVLQVRRRYPEGTSERQPREAWIASHSFDQSWAPSPGRKRHPR